VIAAERDRRDRPLQRRRDHARDVQVAQQAAQPLDQIPGAGDAALRALRRQERTHIPRRQMLQPQSGSELLALCQEQPRDTLVVLDRMRDEPTLAGQIPPIVVQQPLDRSLRHHPRRRRHDAGLAQVRERDPQTSRRNPSAITGRVASLGEPQLMLRGQPIRAQTLDREPVAEMTELINPTIDPASREPLLRQPLRVAGHIRLKRARSRAGPNWPASHRCLHRS
jgi:hypothetical protein